MNNDPWIILLADVRRPLGEDSQGNLMLATMTQDKKTGVWTTTATRYDTEAEAQEAIAADKHPEVLSTMRLSAWTEMKMGRRKAPKPEVSDG